MPLAEAWLEALARRDFDQLALALDPQVRFRALVPGELVDATGAAEVVACYRRWFGDKTGFEFLRRRAEVLVDRVQIVFRARVLRGGRPLIVEQTLWADVEGRVLATLDVVCSGFRPELVASAPGSTHVFDAGDLGCGTGLPREFRTRLSQIPLGHVLEVVTRDASAKEDLPSMARLLGHDVRSVETRADGNVVIHVERKA